MRQTSRESDSRKELSQGQERNQSPATDVIDTESHNAQLRKEWEDRNYDRRPDLFFSSESYEWIRGKTPAQRCVLLLSASPRLTVSPSMYRRHFKMFPNDLELMAQFMRERWQDIPSDQWLQSMATQVAPILAEYESSFRALPYMEEALRKAERREVAPVALLNTEDIAETILSIDSFGEASSRYKEMYQQVISHPLGLDEVLDVRQLFTGEDFTQLVPTDKAKLLRDCLVHLQYATVEQEVYFSVFSRDFVERNNERRRPSFGENRDSPFDLLRRGLLGYDVAHSVLFRTYQPQSIYDFDEDLLAIGERHNRMSGGGVEEYGLQKMILETVRQLGYAKVDTRENADLLVEFWRKNRNPLYGNAVADALSLQQPEHAAGRLMEAMRQDRWNPASLASVLYRIELGRIGISKEGVRYLGRLYDLGEHNNPDFFASRLTARGDIGVFDEEKRLLGYFNLGDLTSDETHLRREVLKITRDLLFSRRRAANDDESLLQNALLEEFSEHYFKLYDDEFFVETGVRFNNLSFREQAWFLHFMHTNTEQPQRISAAKEVVRRYGEDGFKAFLSLEADSESWEDILTVGLLRPRGEQVFRKHAEYLDSISTLEESIRTVFGAERVDERILSAVSEAFFARGREILKGAVKVRSDEGAKKLVTKLSKMKVQTALLADVFDATQNIEDVPIEDFPRLSYMIDRAADIPDEEWETMIRVMEKAHATDPEPYKSSLLAGFRKLRTSAALFHVLKYDKQIIGMMRFDERRDGRGDLVSLYAGSLAIDSDFGNGRLGEALFHASLKTGLRCGVPIEGHAVQGLSIFPKYLECGFVADRVEERGEADRWHMILDPVIIARTVAKKLSKSDFLEHAKRDIGQGRVRFRVSSEPPHAIPPGYLLTRLEEHAGMHYAAFEPVPPEEST